MNVALDYLQIILEPFIPKSHPSGRIKTRVSLRGTMDRPNLDGFVTLSGGELAIERPDVLLSELNVEAQLRGDRIELSRAANTTARLFAADCQRGSGAAI